MCELYAPLTSALGAYYGSRKLHSMAMIDSLVCASNAEPVVILRMICSWGKLKVVDIPTRIIFYLIPMLPPVRWYYAEEDDGDDHDDHAPHCLHNDIHCNSN
jgi:hypothetical protein